MGRTLATALALLLLAVPTASAQGVQLEFHDGYVNLRATNVTVRQILAEWGRLGGTTVVNADRVPGGPVTLQLDRVPEKRALEIVLRAASGYVVAAREAQAPGASAFDRIMVMPPSTAARTGPPPMPQPAAFPQPQPVDPNAEPLEPLTDDQGQPVHPQPGFVPDYDDEDPQPEQTQPAFVPGRRGGVDPSVPPEPMEPPADDAPPADPGPQPLAPGTVTSPTPGVLPVPQQQRRPQ